MAEPRARPVDRWLAVGGIAVGILFYLLPKTPAVVIGSLVVMESLLLHPIWNFWWIEDAAWRRIAALTVVGLMLVCVGAFVWPMPPGSDATMLSAAIRASGVRIGSVGPRWIDRATGVFGTLVGLAVLAALRGFVTWLKNRQHAPESQKGFLDYKLEAETALGKLPTLLGKIGAVMQKVGPAMHAHTGSLQRAETTDRQIGVSRRASQSLNRLSRRMDRVIISYEAVGASLVEGLDGWSLWSSKQAQKKATLLPLINSLTAFIPIVDGVNAQNEEYLETLRALKGISSVLDSGVERHVQSVQKVFKVNTKIRDACVEALLRFDGLSEA